MKKIYHYTVGDHFKQILNDRKIKLATAHIEKNERPAVFCTIDKLWEPTACKSIAKGNQIYQLKTVEQMIKHCGPLIRIEVMPEAVPYSWKDYINMSNINHKLAQGLRVSAIELGSNVNDFYVGFEPITSDKWLSIQMLNENQVWENM